VDAGNYVDRSASGGCSNKCQFMVVSYRDLRYDVLNIGKQEAWMGYETLVQIRDTIKNTEFVSANLIDLNTKRPLFKPYVIKDYGKFRVGVLGLLNEADFPKGNLLLDSVNLSVIPSLDAAKKYIPLLARKTDAIVVMTELGSQQADSLATLYPDIDLILSTGSIRGGEVPYAVKKTHVAGTGSSGYSGHYAMLEFNPSWPDSVAFSSFKDELTDAYDEPGMWADRLAAFNASPARPAAATKAEQKKPAMTAQPAPASSAKPIEAKKSN